MGKIISTKETAQSRRRLSKRGVIIGVIVGIIAIGGGLFLYQKNQMHTVSRTPTEAKIDNLKKIFEEKQAAAAGHQSPDSPEQRALIDAKSSLVDAYMQNKDYDNAQKLLSSQDKLADLQGRAIVAEARGDKTLAISLLKQQIDYFKSLPTTETNYDAEIRRVEDRIMTLEGGQ